MSRPSAEGSALRLSRSEGTGEARAERPAVGRTLAREAAVPAAALVFWLVYFATTRGLPIESMVFPYFLMIVMLILAVPILFDERRKAMLRADAGARPAEDARRTTWRPAAVMIASVLYLGLLALVGFEAATALFLLGLMRVLGVPWVKSLVIAVGCTGALWLIFGVAFGVPI